VASGIRRQGRELALKIIYSFPDQPHDIRSILSGFWREFRFRDDILGEAVEEDEADVPDQSRIFAENLASGAFAKLAEIDSKLAEYSQHWSLERMSRVDLSLLRMGTYELMYCLDVPANVAINEAIEVGKRYGTKETPSFVNGILDRIAKDRPDQE
jgi:N utilization substance protein B